MYSNSRHKFISTYFVVLLWTYHTNTAHQDHSFSYYFLLFKSSDVIMYKTVLFLRDKNKRKYSFDCYIVGNIKNRKLLTLNDLIAPFLYYNCGVDYRHKYDIS